MRKFLFALLASFLLVAVDADDLKMATDPWPPFVFEKTQPAGDGIMVDIIRAAFAKSGHTVELVIVPWSRAVRNVEAGEMDILVGAARNPAKELTMVFPKNEIVANTNAFYIIKANPWTYKGVDSLNAGKFGFVAGYNIPALNDYVKANPDKVEEVSGEAALVSLLKMLDIGRINALIDNSLVIQYQASQLGLTDRIKQAGVLDTVLGYPAISRKNPKAVQLAAEFDKGLEAIRANGEFAKILARYGVSDWK